MTLSYRHYHRCRGLRLDSLSGRCQPHNLVFLYFTDFHQNNSVFHWELGVEQHGHGPIRYYIHTVCMSELHSVYNTTAEYTYSMHIHHNNTRYPEQKQSTRYVVSILLVLVVISCIYTCLLYTSPSPRD